MAKDKKSFVAYTEWSETFEMLSDEEAGKLIKHLLRYVNDENPEMDDRMLKILFQPIKQQLKRDLGKYEDIKKKRAEAGRKGGKKTQKKAKQANASDAKQNQSNQAVNDNDNGNVNDNVNILSKESNKRALDFLKNNYPSRFETDFVMRYGKNIENKQKFTDDFNDTIDQEDLEWTDKKLFARLGKYSRNWIDNQNKYAKHNTTTNDVDNFYKNIPTG
ncbi:DUF6291 domain-containing protein [Mesonia aestuariivivens]|uniref:DUF6291 domain-containing protein n=1 Tax=Mesonia aestuariivivens TaxID=2796128 RepID=A0ABS6W2C7_9FLAO|nr:DUF6291 domain-containing protein [Mesonia aestuariivivens]MBW2961289.1 hypothetical protein [Mesonia aestuariivivens]